MLHLLILHNLMNWKHLVELLLKLARNHPWETYSVSILFWWYCRNVLNCLDNWFTSICDSRLHCHEIVLLNWCYTWPAITHDRHILVNILFWWHCRNLLNWCDNWYTVVVSNGWKRLGNISLKNAWNCPWNWSFLKELSPVCPASIYIVQHRLYIVGLLRRNRN